ncbi:MAG: hypothetical protein WAU78_14125 [Roseiarcus sp.]
MATPGLSLVGFMDQQQAMAHLRTACVPADPSDVAILAEWNAARARLGAPVANAGIPDIQPIPPTHDPHVQQVLTAPWSAPAFQTTLAGVTFQLVELDPLLAYQFTIDDDRSNYHCTNLNKPPSLDTLLALCLPTNPEIVNFQVLQHSNTQQNQSMLLKTKNLNLRSLAAGIFNAQFMGLQFAVSLPFLHVVCYNNRYYLHNGFHRALGIRRAGATYAPAVVRIVTDSDSAGIRRDGSTFDLNLLESNNPPTVGHFTNGRAHPVSLRGTTRVLHVSWAEYVLPDEN